MVNMNQPNIRRALVSGGAGFIGSHITDTLVSSGVQVTVYDNFSTGQDSFVSHHADNPRVRVVRADVLDSERLNQEMADCDFVFHLQANADVRGGISATRIDLEQNTMATWNVLEAMRFNNVKNIAFASSATVYGEPDVFPTPESYAPVQTSLYGASKLACEYSTLLRNAGPMHKR
jgi:UDP-glucose 4-epimerase